MTTRKQIKELAAPLLARHADLALVKDTIVVRPVTHLLNFILIERTGNADVYDPRWGSALLCCRRSQMPIGEAAILYRQEERPLWRWSDPTSVDEFVKIIEADVLPKLRAVRTFRDYWDKAPTHDPEQLIYEWQDLLICGLATGDLDRSKSLLEQNPHVHGKEWGVNFVRTLDEYSDGLGTRLLERGERLEQADRLKLAEHLHDLEAVSVKNLGLEKVWARTPFPIEEADAGASSGAV